MNKISDNNSGVYLIRFKPDGRYYIGSAICFRKRLNVHLHFLRKGNHHSIYLQRLWNKHGESNFEFEILEHCTKSDCITREQVWMDKLKPTLNTTPKAASWLGHKHTSEAKQKMALRASISQRGRKHSEESKLKRSLALKGRKPSPQCIAATIAVCKGRKLTAEHIAKITKASQNMSEETRNKIALAGLGRRHTDHTKMLIAESNRRRARLWHEEELKQQPQLPGL